MARIYKAEIYLTDTSDEIQDLNQLKNALKGLGDRLWVGVDIASVTESKEFEWEDDLKINKINSTIDDLEEYFK